MSSQDHKSVPVDKQTSQLKAKVQTQSQLVAKDAVHVPELVVAMKEQEVKRFAQVSEHNATGFKQNSYQATSLKGNRLT